MKILDEIKANAAGMKTDWRLKAIANISAGGPGSGRHPGTINPHVAPMHNTLVQNGWTHTGSKPAGVGMIRHTYSGESAGHPNEIVHVHEGASHRSWLGQTNGKNNGATGKDNSSLGKHLKSL